MQNRENVKGIAARAAMWSVRHRTLAILAWVAFVVIVSVFGGRFGTHTASDIDQGHGDSQRADRIVEAAGFPVEPAGEMVIVQDRAGTDRKAAITDVSAALKKTSGVSGIKPAITSADGRSSLISFNLSGDPDTAKDRVQPALNAVATVQAAHPDLYIAEAGDASSDKMIGDALDKGLSRLGMLSIPVSLGILLIAFGAVVAAFLPVLLAVMAVVAAMGLLAFASRLAPTVDTTTDVMLLVGLAVGVDYCLFYIRRERDERRNGADKHRALVIAAQTSGRSIWVSGLTVIVAMSGMFLTRDATFNSFAVGTILVVATAVLGSLTVLPALLATLGDKVDAIKLPGLYRKRSDGRFWNGLLRVVLAKPLISALVAVAALGAIAYPALRLHPQAQTLQDLPPKAAVVKALIAVDAAFPSKSSPAQVVIKADSVRGAAFTRTLTSFESSARAHHLAEPFEVQINPAGTVAIVSVGLPAKSDLTVLRGEVVPATFGRLSGATVLVTGDAAHAADFNRSLDDSLPWVFGFVLGLAFLLLLVSFRSVVVAITGVVLNLLSVAAAYGMLVWVFQDGHFASQLQFTPSGGITNWMPLFLFIILFGLSMDYHIFVLSRIQEGHDRGLPTRQAVRDGVGRTAGVITSAAVVMVAVFSLFATLPLASTKQLGIGLAAAVLLDATIIRAILLPAVMALLGEKNWWLPRWLGWLPQIAHEPPAELPAPRPEERELIAA